ncbi:MAG: hypothetical protein KY455_06905 [Euryarchaeota archaeon]|nr:hypothetical protein [Euryarchaeota archaeon]
MATARPQIHDPDRPVSLGLPEAFRDTERPREGPSAVFFVRKDLDEVPSLVPVQREDRFWDFAAERAAPADVDAETDDPFARLLGEDPVEVLSESDDDTPDLNTFFQTPAPRPVETAPAGTTWPRHNYGDAYRAIREGRGIGWARHIEAARQRNRRPAELWDVDEVDRPDETAPVDVEAPPVASSAFNADPAVHAEGEGWLEALESGSREVEVTEARILRGPGALSLPVSVFEADETLFALPAGLRTRPSPFVATVPEAPSLLRNLFGIVGTAGLVLLALIFLQLVFF